jgi:hypothetical protein
LRYLQCPKHQYTVRHTADAIPTPEAPFVRNKRLPKGLYSQDPAKSVPRSTMQCTGNTAAPLPHAEKHPHPATTHANTTANTTLPLQTQPAPPKANLRGGGHSQMRRATAQTCIHVKPQDVGLYAETQESLHCGAHALNSILGRHAVSGPTYISGYLAATNIPADGWGSAIDPYYNIHTGHYQVECMNH